MITNLIHRLICCHTSFERTTAQSRKPTTTGPTGREKRYRLTPTCPTARTQLIDQSKSNWQKKTYQKKKHEQAKPQEVKPKPNTRSERNRIDDNLVQLGSGSDAFPAPLTGGKENRPHPESLATAALECKTFYFLFYFRWLRVSVKCRIEKWIYKSKPKKKNKQTDCVRNLHATNEGKQLNYAMKQGR